MSCVSKQRFIFIQTYISLIISQSAQYAMLLTCYNINSCIAYQCVDLFDILDNMVIVTVISVSINEETWWYSLAPKVIDTHVNQTQIALTECVY